MALMGGRWYHGRMGIRAKAAIWLIKYRKYLLPAAVLAAALVVYLLWFR